jgi:hypothetical protein
MIAFTILTIIAIIAAIIVGIIAVTLGAGFIAVFGDLLLFVAIIWLLVRVFKRIS